MVVDILIKSVACLGPCPCRKINTHSSTANCQSSELLSQNGIGFVNKCQTVLHKLILDAASMSFTNRFSFGERILPDDKHPWRRVVGQFGAAHHILPDYKHPWRRVVGQFGAAHHILPDYKHPWRRVVGQFGAAHDILPDYKHSWRRVVGQFGAAHDILPDYKHSWRRVVGQFGAAHDIKMLFVQKGFPSKLLALYS